MSEYEVSPILGRSKIPDGDELFQILRFVEDAPLAVFQSLNKKFNEKGLCLSIGRLKESSHG